MLVYNPNGGLRWVRTHQTEACCTNVLSRDSDHCEMGSIDFELRYT